MSSVRRGEATTDIQQDFSRTHQNGRRARQQRSCNGTGSSLDQVPTTSPQPPTHSSSPSVPPRPSLGNVGENGGRRESQPGPGRCAQWPRSKNNTVNQFAPVRRDIQGHPRRPRWERMAEECNCPSPRIIGLIAATAAAKGSRNQSRHTAHSESSNMGGRRGDVGGSTLQKMRARGGRKLSKPS